MEACGIDVFKTARDNGYQIDTQKDTYGQWNFFALILLEQSMEKEVTVCYCANVTEEEILRHVAVEQCCSTLDEIKRHTGANTGCKCLTENPAGG